MYMKYCVCTEALFGDKKEIYDALADVKRAGYDGYEFWFWWDRDLKRLRQKQDELGLSCAAVCAKFMLNPGDREEQGGYLEDFAGSIRAAKELGCTNLIVQAGWEKPGLPREKHRETLLDTLSKAAKLAAPEGITLVLEPLNIKVDHAGYHLWDTQDAFGLIRRVGEPNVKLLFDIYHQQVSNGNIIASLKEGLDIIGHIHAAGCPGRGEITGGELDYRHIFTALGEMGYEGFCGLEYFTDRPGQESILEAKGILAY
ncbi:MAG: TIM barrel protein [Lachnospiraceae bacterium]|jgi:hydroxypyruvate isomerase|nr:TIM barrel protein [Lachnospiraceae bacterium]